MTIEDGFLRGNYRGVGAAIIREGAYRGLALGLYEPIKKVLNGDKPMSEMPAWKKYLAAGSSGVIGSIIGNPTDIIKTRQQGAPVGQHFPISWYMKDIFNKRGMLGFFDGLVPTMARALVFNAVYLGTYEQVKHTLLEERFKMDGNTVSC